MQRTNTMALVSLIAGIVSWVAMPFVAAIVAVVCGHMARKQIRASFGAESGDGLAVAGLLLGYINLAGSIIAILVVVLMFMGMACAGIAAGAAGG